MRRPIASISVFALSVVIACFAGSSFARGGMKHAYVTPERSPPQRWQGSALQQMAGSSVVNVNWSNIIAISNSSATCQVVSNAILAREWPPSRLSFQRLQELTDAGMQYTRFVPWYPLPHYGVPELSPGVWNASLATEMLEDLWEATGGNRSDAKTIINFSTQPLWLYADSHNYSVPDDPLKTTFDFPHSGTVLADPSGQEMADYFAGLVSWIRYGARNGPKYPIDHWEFLNEANGCRNQTIKEYTLYFDRFVQTVRASLPHGADDLTYVGLALGSGRPTVPEELEWIHGFLNESNHLPGTFDAVANGISSFHFYAGAHSRTNPKAYEGIFDAADDWIENMVQPALQARRKLSPSTRYDTDELGVILPGDNDPESPQFPLVYWNAAAALFAYEYSRLAIEGVEIVGMSQWAGNRQMTIAGMEADVQFPSVSIMNYTTGEGTARYWTLKLLVEAFGPGDRIAKTVVGQSPMCGVMDGRRGYRNVSLECAGDNSTISRIDFAAFGTPYGTCGDFHHNDSCDASNATAVAEALCLGKQSCSVPSFPALGDPCHDTYKRLIVQARCSDGMGGQAKPGPAAYYAQAFSPAPGQTGLKGKRRVLVINMNAGPVTAQMGDAFPGGNIAALVVDEASGFGPARKVAIGSDGSLPLSDFAVAVVVEGL